MSKKLFFSKKYIFLQNLLYHSIYLSEKNKQTLGKFNNFVIRSEKSLSLHSEAVQLFDAHPLLRQVYLSKRNAEVYQTAYNPSLLPQTCMTESYKVTPATNPSSSDPDLFQPSTMQLYKVNPVTSPSKRKAWGTQKGLQSWGKSEGDLLKKCRGLEDGGWKKKKRLQLYANSEKIKKNLYKNSLKLFNSDFHKNSNLISSEVKKNSLTKNFFNFKNFNYNKKIKLQNIKNEKKFIDKFLNISSKNLPYKKSFFCYWLLPFMGFVSCFTTINSYIFLNSNEVNKNGLNNFFLLQSIGIKFQQNCAINKNKNFQYNLLNSSISKEQTDKNLSINSANISYLKSFSKNQTINDNNFKNSSFNDYSQKKVNSNSLKILIKKLYYFYYKDLEKNIINPENQNSQGFNNFLNILNNFYFNNLNIKTRNYLPFFYNMLPLNNLKTKESTFKVIWLNSSLNSYFLSNQSKLKINKFLSNSKKVFELSFKKWSFLNITNKDFILQKSNFKKINNFNSFLNSEYFIFCQKLEKDTYSILNDLFYTSFDKYSTNLDKNFNITNLSFLLEIDKNFYLPNLSNKKIYKNPILSFQTASILLDRLITPTFVNKLDNWISQNLVEQIKAYLLNFKKSTSSLNLSKVIKNKMNFNRSNKTYQRKVLNNNIKLPSDELQVDKIFSSLSIFNFTNPKINILEFYNYKKNKINSKKNLNSKLWIDNNFKNSNIKKDKNLVENTIFFLTKKKIPIIQNFQRTKGTWLKIPFVNNQLVNNNKTIIFKKISDSKLQFRFIPNFYKTKKIYLFVNNKINFKLRLNNLKNIIKSVQENFYKPLFNNSSLDRENDLYTRPINTFSNLNEEKIHLDRKNEDLNKFNKDSLYYLIFNSLKDSLEKIITENFIQKRFLLYNLRTYKDNINKIPKLCHSKLIFKKKVIKKNFNNFKPLNCIQIYKNKLFNNKPLGWLTYFNNLINLPIYNPPSSSYSDFPQPYIMQLYTPATSPFISSCKRKAGGTQKGLQSWGSSEGVNRNGLQSCGKSEGDILKRRKRCRGLQSWEIVAQLCCAKNSFSIIKLNNPIWMTNLNSFKNFKNKTLFFILKEKKNLFLDSLFVKKIFHKKERKSYLLNYKYYFMDKIYRPSNLVFNKKNSLNNILESNQRKDNSVSSQSKLIKENLTKKLIQNKESNLIYPISFNEKSRMILDLNLPIDLTTQMKNFKKITNFSKYINFLSTKIKKIWLNPSNIKSQKKMKKKKFPKKFLYLSKAKINFIKINSVYQNSSKRKARVLNVEEEKIYKLIPPSQFVKKLSLSKVLERSSWYATFGVIPVNKENFNLKLPKSTSIFSGLNKKIIKFRNYRYFSKPKISLIFNKNNSKVYSQGIFKNLIKLNKNKSFCLQNFSKFKILNFSEKRNKLINNLNSLDSRFINLGYSKKCLIKQNFTNFKTKPKLKKKQFNSLKSLKLEKIFRSYLSKKINRMNFLVCGAKSKNKNFFLKDNLNSSLCFKGLKSLKIHLINKLILKSELSFEKRVLRLIKNFKNIKLLESNSLISPCRLNKKFFIKTKMNLKVKNFFSPNLLLKNDSFIKKIYLNNKLKNFYENSLDLTLNNIKGFSHYLSSLDEEKYEIKKDRKEKQREESHRGKKRQRSYPRPVWFDYNLYTKFLKLRHFEREKTLTIKRQNSRKVFFSNPKFLNFYSNFTSTEKSHLKYYPFLIDTHELKNIYKTTNLLRQKIYRNYKQKWLKINLKTNYLNNYDNRMKNQERIFPESLENKNGNKLTWLFNSRYFSFFANKNFYVISRNTLIDLKRLFCKSYWLRSNLNPYLNRVNYYLAKMKELTKNYHLNLSIKNFLIETTFNSSKREIKNQEDFWKFSKQLKKKFPYPYKDIISNTINLEPLTSWGMRNGWIPMMENEKVRNNLKKNANNLELYGNINIKNYLQSENYLNSTFSKNWQIARNLTEYQRIIFQRIQQAILNIRKNLKLNWKTKTLPSKMGYQKLPTPKSIKRVKFGKGIPLEIQNNCPINFYGDISKLRTMWTLNKSNLAYFKASNKRKNIWINYKLREQREYNQTKKIIYQMSTKLNNLLNEKYIMTDKGNELSNLSLSKTLTIKPFFNRFIINNLSIDFYPENISKNANLNQLSSKTLLEEEINALEDIDYTVGIEKFKHSLEIYESKFRRKENKLSYLGFLNKKTNKLSILRELKKQLLTKSTSRNKKFQIKTSFLSEAFKNTKSLKINLVKPTYLNLIFFNKFTTEYNYWWNSFSLKLIPEFKNMGNSNVNKNHIRNFYPNDLIIWVSTFLFHFCALLFLINSAEIRELIKFNIILFSNIFKTYLDISLKVSNTLFENFNAFNTSNYKNNLNYFSKKLKNSISIKEKNKNIKQFYFNDINSGAMLWLNQSIKMNLNTNSKEISFIASNFKLYSFAIQFFISSKKEILDQLKPLNVMLNQTKVNISNKVNSKNKIKTYNINFFSELIYLSFLHILTKILLHKNKQNLLVFNKKILSSKVQRDLFDIQPSVSNQISDSLIASICKDSLNPLKEKQNFYINEYKLFNKKLGLLSTSLILTLRNKDLIKKMLYINKKTFPLTKYYLVNLLKLTLSLSSNGLFWIYSFFLKSLDIFQFIMGCIYLFLEKPGELILDWIAYAFVVKWSSDLITIIPDVVDSSRMHSFLKISRGVRPFLITNSLYGSPTSNNSFLFSLSLLFSGLIQRGMLNIYETLIEKWYQPENDLIIRQKKGIIFWDLWSEVLIEVAEDANINLSELTSLKEEQNRLLEKLEEYGLEDSQVSIINFNNKNSRIKKIWVTKLSPEVNQPRNISKNFYFIQRKPYYLLKNHYENSTYKNEKIQDLTFSKKRLALINQTRGIDKKFENQLLRISCKGNWSMRSIDQFLNYQGKDTELFIQKSPSKSFLHIPSIKYSQSALQPIGTIVCQIFSGLFKQQIAKNILIIGSSVAPCMTESYKVTPSLGRESLGLQRPNKVWVAPQHSEAQTKFELGFPVPPTSNSSSAMLGLVAQQSGAKFSQPSYFPQQGKSWGLYDKAPFSCKRNAGGFLIPRLKKLKEGGLLRISSRRGGTRVGETKNETLFIQAIAGETELKIITDNAHRYSTMYGGVPVGIKLLKDVFETLSFHTPCIFLLEDIHHIGIRRPFLISDQIELGKDTDFGSEKEEIHEKNQVIYELSKHLITHYKKPYRGDFSLLIPTNHFCFNLFKGVSSAQIRNNQIPLSNSLNSDSSNEIKDLSSKPKDESQSRWSENGESKNNILSTSLQIKSNNLLAPPATSPFSVLLLKQDTKLNAQQVVKEIPWAGFSTEKLTLISKSNYSIRVKIALLADMALSNLSVKLDMITDLLIIIDSVKGNRGFIVFATTHIPYVLDPALRRPGRFDETISLPLIPNLFSRWEILKTNLQNLTKSSPYSSFSRGLSIDFTNISGIFTTTLHSEAMQGNPSNKCGVTNDLSKFSHKFLTFNTKLKFQQSGSITLKNTFKNENLISNYLTLTYHLNNKHQQFIYPFQIKNYLFKKNSEILNTNLTVKKIFTSIKNFITLRNQNSKNYSSKIFINMVARTYFYVSQILTNFSLQDSPKVSSIFINTKVKDKLPYSNSASNEETLKLSKKTGQKYFDTKLKKKEEKNFTIPPFFVFDSSIYLSLYTSKKTLKKYFTHLISGKLGELLIFSPNNSKPNSKYYSKSNHFIANTGLMNLYGIDKTWRSATSLLFSLITKRYIYNKNLIIPKLFYFSNYSSLNDTPTPPTSNILLPLKRYENYRQTFYTEQIKNKANFQGKTLQVILELHQQQRFIKRLYKLPLREFFRSEIINDKLTGLSNSLITLSPVEKTINFSTNMNWYYRNGILNRHRNYLNNQWWNGQLNEHNVESTFLSDIDWRHTFVESIGDIFIDFPDSDQFYHVKNRRWMLTSNSWENCFSFEKTSLDKIFNQYMFDCFTQAYNSLDQYREILDFYAFTSLNECMLKEFKEITIINLFKRLSNSN
uniref:Cell division protein n=1 Tax=Microglena monadina TaxID=47904 RepID=A0A0S2IBQ8_9CHLO|nr:cell division protein [Microglena monadina]